MNKLVPCAWLSSGASEVWWLRLRYAIVNFLTSSALYYKCDRHGRRPGAEFGGTKKIFRGPISGKFLFQGKNVHFQGKNFWWPVLLVIDLVLWIFPFFSHIFRIFTMLNVVYDHFLTRKTSFFTLFILSRTSDNTTSQNIGGTNTWAVPTSNFGMDRPPSPPRSPPLLLGLLFYILIRHKW